MNNLIPNYFSKRFLEIAMEPSPLMKEALRKDIHVVIDFKRGKAKKIRAFDSITRAKKYAKKLKFPIILSKELYETSNYEHRPVRIV